MAPRAQYCWYPPIPKTYPTVPYALVAAHFQDPALCLPAYQGYGQDLRVFLPLGYVRNVQKEMGRLELEEAWVRVRIYAVSECPRARIRRASWGPF